MIEKCHTSLLHSIILVASSVPLKKFQCWSMKVISYISPAEQPCRFIQPLSGSEEDRNDFGSSLGVIYSTK